MTGKWIFATSALVLAFSAGSAQAQDDPAHAMIVQGPHAKLMLVPESPSSPESGKIEESGLVTIFDSIAGKYPKGKYWCCEGYNVMGPNQGEQWMGGGFTPTTNHTVTRIEVAVGWSQGPNGVVLSLNADSNGVPGQVLKSWSISNLPVFGTCCTLVVKTDKAGIPVTAGQQYWVVLSTNDNEADTVDGWNVSDADQIDQGTFASFSSNTWHTFQTAPGLAFAVKGPN